MEHVEISKWFHKCKSTVFSTAFRQHFSKADVPWLVSPRLWTGEQLATGVMMGGARGDGHMCGGVGGVDGPGDGGSEDGTADVVSAGWVLSISVNFLLCKFGYMGRCRIALRKHFRRRFCFVQTM